MCAFPTLSGSYTGCILLSLPRQAFGEWRICGRGAVKEEPVFAQEIVQNAYGLVGGGDYKSVILSLLFLFSLIDHSAQDKQMLFSQTQPSQHASSRHIFLQFLGYLV